MKPINFLFEVFNVDGMKNREVTRVASLEIEINSHKEQLEAAITDLDRMDMFLGYNWLVKHNPEVNWKNSTIRFTRCPEQCMMKHKDIRFKTRRTKATDNMEQDNGEIGKELDSTNSEDLPDYVRPFTYLFNKNKFEKLPERHEWDYEINLMEEAPKELNAKVYAIIPKKDGSLQLVQDYRKLNQVTIKDKTPLSLIREVIDKLKEAKYFNKLDLIWRYNNIQIKEGNKWKAMFLTNKGLFKPQVIYFGLCNSPETF